MDATQAYRESEVTAENPVRLVILLYDQLLRDLHRALTTIETQDIPGRCQELDHAFVVIGQLQGTLNLEQGGEVAQSLDGFYNSLRDNLLRAGLEGSPTLLERQRENVLSVREAWLEVERQQTEVSPNSSRKSEAGQHPEERAARGATWSA